VAWSEDFERVEKLRDEMAAELRKTYLAAVAALVDLLGRRIPAVDAQVSHVNRHAPSGARSSERRAMPTVLGRAAAFRSPACCRSRPISSCQSLSSRPTAIATSIHGRRRSRRWRRACWYRAALDQIGTRRPKSATAGAERRASASQLITRNASESLLSAGRPSFARPERRIGESMGDSFSTR
jgi:hypothetical protein